MEYWCRITFPLAITALAAYFLYVKRLRSKYPPGPWPLPIVGNLLLLSKTPHVDFTRLSKKYGPVFTVWLGWQPIVILNRYYLIKEATIQKGLEFSGRAIETKGFKSILYDNQDLLMQSYNEKVEIMRELALSITKTTSVKGWSIKQIISEEMQDLIQNLTNLNKQVVDLQEIISVPVSNIIVRSVLNIRFQNTYDLKYQEWLKLNTDAHSAIEKAQLVHVFPILWYVMPNVRKEIEVSSVCYDSFLKHHIKQHKETYRHGIFRDLTDAIIDYQLEHAKDEPSKQLTNINVAGLIRDILGAGTDSIIASIRWCFLVLLHRPDIKEKIHRELDEYISKEKKFEYCREEGTQETCGPTKLVFDMEDRANLPYLNAFIYEMMRRCSPGPLAPRKTVADTSVAGNTIPKDTAVTFNIYASNMDEQHWDSPYDFVPERFIDNHGQFNTSLAKLLIPFSAGPRSCVGENLATMEIFICVANVLHSFDVCCSPSEKLPTLYDVKYKLESAPFPYKIIFQLR